MVMEELTSQEKRLRQIKQLLEYAVGDETDELEYDQFVQFSKDSMVQAYFRRLGIHVDMENANAIFHLIDRDSDGIIRVQDFLNECTQFLGNARQLDIVRLRRDHEETRDLLYKLARHLGQVDAKTNSAAPVPTNGRPASMAWVTSSMAGKEQRLA